MSRERFLQLKHALENEETTFEIGNATDRTSCMVYKHGACNFIYGFRVQFGFEIPRLGISDRPQLLAISDDKGRNIALVDKFTFIDITEGLDFDVEVAPYYIDNQIAAMNERLSSEYVTYYRDALALKDFEESTASDIQASATFYARRAAVQGTAIESNRKIVHEEEYLAIRSGTLDEAVLTQEFCNENRVYLIVERLAEEALEQGILNETEAALVEMLHNLPETAKAITLNFEREGRASLKIDPDRLGRRIIENCAFSKYDFKNDKDYETALTFEMRSVSINNPLNIYDIESVTYGAKTLYVRDDGGNRTLRQPQSSRGQEENVKEKKRADIYER